MEVGGFSVVESGDVRFAMSEMHRYHPTYDMEGSSSATQDHLEDTGRK
jgi:hypothetical protein